MSGMEEDITFLRNLLTFAHWVTLATGTLGAGASVTSFVIGNTVPAILYLVGSVVLLAASTYLRKMRKKLTEGAPEL